MNISVFFYLSDILIYLLYFSSWERKFLKSECSSHFVSAKHENIAPISRISALNTSQSYSKINCTIEMLTEQILKKLFVM